MQHGLTQHAWDSCDKTVGCLLQRRTDTLQYATDKTPGHNPLNRNPLSRYAGRLELGPRLVGRTESGVRVRASFPQIPHRVLCCGSIKGRGLGPRGVLSGRVDLIPWSACMSDQCHISCSSSVS